jgi:hypothetical protein
MTWRNNGTPVMADIKKVLPDEITRNSVRSGDEWIIPLHHVVEAIDIATANLIAVLGLEIFRISPSGFFTEGYSGYDFKRGADWGAFVQENNKAASQYVALHQFGEGYGYILTTTSAEEFSPLRDKLNE